MSQPITKGQIKKIKVLQRRKGMSEESYRQFLASLFKARSCKELNTYQAAILITTLEEQAPPGVGRATAAQMQTILKLWESVSYAPPAYKLQALRQFLKRQCGVEQLHWIPRHKVPAVICALKAISIHKEGGPRYATPSLE